jgi:hypothetical protein
LDVDDAVLDKSIAVVLLVPVLLAVVVAVVASA